MSNIPSELQEVNRLIEKLESFSKGMASIQSLLPELFLKVKKVYRCDICGTPSNQMRSSCDACGSRIPLSEILELENKNSPLKHLNSQYGYSEEAMRILEFLIKHHEETLSIFPRFMAINLLKDLHYVPNYPLESLYVRIFLLLNTSEQHNFEHDYGLLRSVLTNISNLAKIEKIKLGELERFCKNGKPHSAYINTLSLLFSEDQDLIHLLIDIEQEIKSIKESKTMKEIRSMCSRRLSMNLNPYIVNPLFSGKITINIRNVVDKPGLVELQRIMDFLLKGIESVGSVESYYSKVKSFLRQSVERLLIENKDLFYVVYGKKLNITLFFDVEFLKGAAAFVGQRKIAYIQGKSVSVSKYDPALKNLEINIDAEYFFNCVILNQSEDFKNVLVHELGHLFDKKIEISSEIRREGIARFTEYAYNKRDSSFDGKIIAMLMSKPISTLEDYIEIDSRFFSSSKISELPYCLGEYICVVIYFGSIKKKQEMLIKDINQMKDYLNKLLRDREANEYVKTVVNVMREMSDRNFFDLYFKNTKLLGFKPIFTEEFIVKLLNKFR